MRSDHWRRGAKRSLGGSPRQTVPRSDHLDNPLTGTHLLPCMDMLGETAGLRRGGGEGGGQVEGAAREHVTGGEASWKGRAWDPWVSKQL